MSVRLDPREAIAAGFERSAYEQLDLALRDFGGAAASRDPANYAARRAVYWRVARSGVGDGGALEAA